MTTLPVINAALILPKLEVPDWESAIRLLGARLEAEGYTHSSYVQAVIDREKVFPTGLPLGELNVAIPHTDVVHVKTPGIAIATLKDPITFQQMGSPEESVQARIVFLLAMTDPKDQVNLLANLVDIFQKGDVLQAIIDANDPMRVESLLNAELHLHEVV
ncbi:MAG: PTS sugar transporter subunit IIA [Mycobacterium leprae]